MGAVIFTILRMLGQMLLAVVLSPLMIKRALFAVLNFAKSKLGMGSQVSPVIDQAEKILDEAIPEDGTKPNLPNLPSSK